MVFIICIALVILALIVGFVVDDELFLFLVIGGVFLGLIISLVGTATHGPNHIVESTPITHLEVYPDPNGDSNIYSFIEHGQRIALHNDADLVTLKPDDNARVEKICSYNSQYVVPWKVSNCTYTVYAPLAK